MDDGFFDKPWRFVLLLLFGGLILFAIMFYLDSVEAKKRGCTDYVIQEGQCESTHHLQLQNGVALCVCPGAK